jgi:outer membrane protein OmpA-like peptidoglycan-associated protein
MARTSSALALAALAALALACKSRPPEPSVEDKLAQELMDQGLLSRKDERGLVLYLPDVLFEFDRADLTDAANAKIAAVAEIVVRLAPERNLSVEGHTDAVGDEEYNLELSLRRAIAVSDALQAGGVAAERLRTVGHGERFPVAENRTPDGRDDPAGRAANRRVEVVIERPS